MRLSQSIVVIASVLMVGCSPPQVIPGHPPSGSGGSTSSNSGAGGGATTSGAGGGGHSGSGTSDGGTSGATGGTSGSGGATTVELSCVPGIPATSQIPRMKDAAYDAVIHDLLGLTGLSSNANQPPSSLLAPDSEGERLMSCAE